MKSEQNIESSTYSFFIDQRRVVADDIVDGNANGKGDSSINGLSINLFRVQLVDSSHHDSLPKLTDIQDLGPRNALGHETFQGQIHNLGSLLVLGTDITEKSKDEIIEQSD